MTNFEITFNLFQNLNKFEQKEIITQFLDKMYEQNVNESLQNFDTKEYKQKCETNVLTDEKYGAIPCATITTDQLLSSTSTATLNKSYNLSFTKSCDEIFDQASKLDTNNVEKVCTNFFDAVDEANAVIHTNSVEEIEELHKLFFNSIPNGTTFHQDGLTENDLKYANELGFEIDKYIITFGHISFFEREDYNIISFKDLKKLLKFE